jgi:hypothetical protein
MRFRELFGVIALSVFSPAIVAQEIAVQLASGDEWVRRDDAIELTVAPFPAREEGRLAIMIGEADLSELFTPTGEGLRYQSHLMPLPPGQNEIVAYLVRPQGDWVEIARLPLKVLRKGGLERVAITPRMDIQGKGQFDEKRAPDDGSPANTYEDGTVQGDLRVELERSEWILSSELNVVGVTNIQEALRFGTEGEDADKIDLSRYAIRLTRGEGFVEVGHVLYGNQQHLIGSFSSRGVTAKVPLGSFIDLSGVVMNGTSIVGWNNFLGLSRSEHQIAALTLGGELVPSQKGALRVEGTWMDGSLAPESSFNQGSINDKETSEGWGVRVLSNTMSSRISVDAGWARSRFVNPFDPLLAQGDDLVAVEEEDRDARYLTARFAILQSLEVGENLYTDLSIGVQHERVDPQYRSVATFAQADNERNGADLSWMLGAFSMQIGHSENEDNLDRVPSILTTKTKNSSASLSLALPQMLASSPRATLWPNMSYGFNRTHQYGLDVPENSGFSESHVPDQISRSHNASLQWSGSKWRFGYSLNYSTQDNRQTERENNDFSSLNHGWSIGLTPVTPLDIGLDLSRERAFSFADARKDYNRRYGVTLGWHITPSFDFNGSFSHNESENDPKTSESEGELIDAQLSYRFEWRRGDVHGVSAQAFVRYSDQDFASIDTQFGFATANATRTINGGLSLSFY